MIKKIESSSIRLLGLILLSLLFLSLNSILCKIALANEYIDAYTFTFFRLLFAAITLMLILVFQGSSIKVSFKSNWGSSFMLFLYAVGFSYAYLSLDAGFGTLLLFAVVQITMLISSLLFKEKIDLKKLFGIILAFLGLVYLLYPNEKFEISYFHVLLMIIAGFAWGVYSVLGKKSKNALFNTYDNFFKASIFIVLFYILFVYESLIFSSYGVFIAFISGSLTSAIGYTIWYKTLPNLTIVTASTLQLLVPIIAVLLSVAFLEEVFTLNLLISMVLVSVGVIVSIYPK